MNNYNDAMKWIQTDNPRAHDLIYKEIDKLKSANDELLVAIKGLVNVIDAHSLESLSCDRDGEEYCDCLSLQVENTRNTIAKAEEVDDDI